MQIEFEYKLEGSGSSHLCCKLRAKVPISLPMLSSAHFCEQNRIRPLSMESAMMSPERHIEE